MLPQTVPPVQGTRAQQPKCASPITTRTVSRTNQVRDGATPCQPTSLSPFVCWRKRIVAFFRPGNRRKMRIVVCCCKCSPGQDTASASKAAAQTSSPSALMVSGSPRFLVYSIRSRIEEFAWTWYNPQRAREKWREREILTKLERDQNNFINCQRAPSPFPLSPLPPPLSLVTRRRRTTQSSGEP